MLHGDIELMDPTSSEEAMSEEGQDHNENHGTMTVALLPTFSQVAQLVQVGSADPAYLETCLTELVEVGAEIHRAVKATLQHSVNDLLRQRKERQEDAEQATATQAENVS